MAARAARLAAVRAVSLDATGTVVRVRGGAVGALYLAAAAARGWRWPAPAPPPATQRRMLEQAFGAAWRAQCGRRPCFGGGGGMAACSSREWWAALVRRSFLAALARAPRAPGPLAPPPLALGHSLFDAFRGGALWELCPGALEALRALRAASLPTVVLSNFDERLEGVLRGLGVRQYFAAVLTSRGLRQEKPSAAAFLAAAAALDVAPAAVLHVGDHATRDYASARAAGMQALLLSPAQAPHCIPSLAALPPLLATPLQ